MGHLDKNWLTYELIDFKYKKCIILSYLKHVQQDFTDKKLFPVLTDLINHYRNLLLAFERLSITNTFEKIEMIKMNKSLPKPATYAISSIISFPYEGTYLPIARKMLENHLAA